MTTVEQEASRQNLSRESDHELIQSALAGNQHGFEQLARRYQDRLFASIRRQVGCPTLAEDIVQDALVRAFMALDSFRGGSGFYTWLYRIALNSRRTYLRKNRATVPLQQDLAETNRMGQISCDAPTDRIERHEEQREVRQALARLDEPHQRILMLREFDGCDYQTIAAILHVKMGTVRSRLARARSRLRKELIPYVEPELSPKTRLSKLGTRPGCGGSSPAGDAYGQARV